VKKIILSLTVLMLFVSSAFADGLAITTGAGYNEDVQGALCGIQSRDRP